MFISLPTCPLSSKYHTSESSLIIMIIIITWRRRLWMGVEGIIPWQHGARVEGSLLSSFFLFSSIVLASPAAVKYTSDFV